MITRILKAVSFNYHATNEMMMSTVTCEDRIMILFVADDAIQTT